MITSTANAQIKHVMKLKKSASYRRKHQEFLVEGIRMVQELEKEHLKRLYVTEEFFKQHGELFAGQAYEMVSEAVFKELSDTMTPQGVLAVANYLSYSFQQVLEMAKESGCPPALLLLENLQDPGNLGTILRMAEGAGITGVILSKDTVDIYNPKVVRSTMGSIFRVPFCYVENLADTVKQLHESGIMTFAAHLQGDNFYGMDFTKGVCIFIGNEGNGLTEELTGLANNKVKIPMKGQVESLNAATAATVFSYEILRQRSS